MLPNPQHQHAIDGERAEIADARADLTTLERAGVSGEMVTRVVGSHDCGHAGLLRAQIGSAKEVLSRDVSATELRAELEPIARGQAGSYDDEERKAAAGIIKELERAKLGDLLCVGRDWHDVLHAPEKLAEQVQLHEQAREAQRERVREQEREHSRGMSRGM